MELGTGLHQLAVMAERYVAEHDGLPATAVADNSRSAAAVPAAIREALVTQLGGFTDAYRQRIVAQLDQIDPDSIAAKATDPYQWMAAQLAGPMSESLSDARAALGDLPTDNPALLSYLMQYSQAVDRRPLLPTIRRALLITAVAASETLLTGVLRRIQYDQGGADRWGPLWDAPELEKRIRRLTGGSINDWAPRLAKNLGVDLADATCHWPAVTEIWARRHVLVHNAGLADQMYANRVPGAVPGVLLEVDAEYLRNAIDLLCGFVLGVILGAWAAQAGRRNFVVQLADLFAADAESELRWPLAENLHQFAASHDDNREPAAASQVNAWLARTRSLGPESVVAQVRQWQVNDLPRRFTLARQVLLGRTAEAIAMLPDLLAKGEINKNDLRNWPLFDTLRELPDFQLLLDDA